MGIKLIAIDLDDTLLKGDLSVSPGNASALRERVLRGVRVVLASGRNIHSMRKYASELGIDGPDDLMICTNGAEIVRTATGESIYENRMSPELCRQAIEALKPYGLPWQIYVGGR